MTGILVTAALATPDEARMEEYLAWTAAGERDRLWDAAADRYRTHTCLGRPEACPDLGEVALGTPVDRSPVRCDRMRDRCTFVRTDRYDAPPFAWSEAVEIDWIVTTDLQGRFDGVAVVWREPGAGLTAAARFAGVLCGMAATFLAVWGTLVGLLRVGRRDA